MNILLSRAQRGALAGFVLGVLLMLGVWLVHIIGTAYASPLPTRLDPLFIFVFVHPIWAGMAGCALVISWVLMMGYAAFWLFEVFDEREPTWVGLYTTQGARI